MCQVAAVRQTHAQQGVAGFHHRHVDGLVGLAAGVRLDVGVFGSEEFLGAFDGSGRAKDVPGPSQNLAASEGPARP